MVLLESKSEQRTDEKFINKSEKDLLEEYRKLEEKSEERHEYHGGKIVKMTGGTINHNRIIRNLIRILDLAFQNTSYEVFTSDLRLYIPEFDRATYPDILVVNGEPILNNNRKDEILNPCLIIEVLSPSTQNYDRGDKFLCYRSIPYLKEYVLISQKDFFVEYYRKTAENQWLLQEYKGEETEFKLEDINVSLSMKDCYQKISFKED